MFWCLVAILFDRVLIDFVGEGEGLSAKIFFSSKSKKNQTLAVFNYHFGIKTIQKFLFELH
jgi:hypothetical protein